MQEHPAPIPLSIFHPVTPGIHDSLSFKALF